MEWLFAKKKKNNQSNNQTIKRNEACQALSFGERDRKKIDLLRKQLSIKVMNFSPGWAGLGAYVPRRDKEAKKKKKKAIARCNTSDGLFSVWKTLQQDTHTNDRFSSILPA